MRGHLLSDYAWSQGSRGQRMGCLGAPWILAIHQGLVGQETLLDQEARRVPSLLSGQGHRQSQEHLEVQANPQSLPRLAVLWGLEGPGALSSLADPQDQGVLAPP